jgi:hypothetical protein
MRDFCREACLALPGESAFSLRYLSDAEGLAARVLLLAAVNVSADVTCGSPIADIARVKRVRSTQTGRMLRA